MIRKLKTARRKSKAGWQTWNRHINAFCQRLANKRLRFEVKKEIEGILKEQTEIKP